MVELLQFEVFSTKTTLWPADPIPHLKRTHSPVPQSGSVLCPLLMDYCEENGGCLGYSR